MNNSSFHARARYASLAFNYMAACRGYFPLRVLSSSSFSRFCAKNGKFMEALCSLCATVKKLLWESFLYFVFQRVFARVLNRLNVLNVVSDSCFRRKLCLLTLMNSEIELELLSSIPIVNALKSFLSKNSPINNISFSMLMITLGTGLSKRSSKTQRSKNLQPLRKKLKL